MNSDEVPRIPGRAPRLHEQIAEQLEREIRSGGFAAGLHLTEMAIADRFGVSRGPVRNAFKRLAHEGLLVRSGPRRFVVADAQKTVSTASAPDSFPLALATAASWEGIYSDVAKVAVIHAVYGSWRVVETELGQSFGVSRTVAREVLARLEQRGILRKDDRIRWHLPKLDARRVANLYEMRSILEPVALEQAVARAPRELLTEMYDELLEADDVADLPAAEFDRLERRLHVDLLAHASNDLLKDALHHCHALLFTNASLYRATRSKFGRDPFPGEHLDILREVLHNRIAGAQERLRAHMQISLIRAVDRLSYINTHVPLQTASYFQPI